MMMGICRPVSVLAALLRNAVRLFSCPVSALASPAKLVILFLLPITFDWLIAPLSALNEVETFERLLS